MLIAFLALAVVDSINPSAIVVTLYLLSRGRAVTQVVAYVAVIFVTYLTLGVMMMSGVQAVLPRLGGLTDGKIGVIAQSLIGLAMLLYAIRAPTTRPPASRFEPTAHTPAALVLLGVTVTMMELPTAVPYFGAIALLTGAELPASQWLPLLVVYNAIFVLPPLLLLAGHVALGSRLDARYLELKKRLQAGARETMLWILGLVGGALLVSGAIEYAVRFM